jgi:hypothetical protein
MDTSLRTEDMTDGADTTTEDAVLAAPVALLCLLTMGEARACEANRSARREVCDSMIVGVGYV